MKRESSPGRQGLSKEQIEGPAWYLARLRAGVEADVEFDMRRFREGEAV